MEWEGRPGKFLGWIYKNEMTLGCVQLSITHTTLSLNIYIYIILMSHHHIIPQKNNQNKTTPSQSLNKGEGGKPPDLLGTHWLIS